MRGWSTAILGVVLVALAGYIYFVDSKTEPGTAETKEKPFGTLTAGDIEEVRVKAGGDTARLTKSNGQWQLVEPEQAPADETELNSMTSSLSSLEINRIVDANAGDLKQYGLDPPRVDVAFKVKGQKDDKRLALGEKTPTGGDIYAQVPGQKRVFLVSSFLDATFNKTPFALRDKTILKVDRDKVDGLDLTTGTTTIELTKKGSEWTLVKPFAARADFATTEGAMERLTSAQMVGLVPAKEGMDALFGFDKPSAVMAIKSGSSRATLTLGKTENAVVFAKDSARPIVFTVPPTLKDDVVKKVEDFRRKDLFDGRSFTITHIEFTRGGDKVALDKSRSKDEKTKQEKDVWKNGAGKDVDTMKAEDLLNKVTGLRAASFEEKAHPSLKTPALVVTTRFGDNRTETVTFARSGMDVYASRADEPGAAKVDMAGFDEAMKSVDGVK